MVGLESDWGNFSCTMMLSCAFVRFEVCALSHQNRGFPVKVGGNRPKSAEFVWECVNA